MHTYRTTFLFIHWIFSVGINIQSYKQNEKIGLQAFQNYVPTFETFQNMQLASSSRPTSTAFAFESVVSRSFQSGFRWTTVKRAGLKTLPGRQASMFVSLPGSTLHARPNSLTNLLFLPFFHAEHSSNFGKSFAASYRERDGERKPVWGTPTWVLFFPILKSECEGNGIYEKYFNIENVEGSLSLLSFSFSPAKCFRSVGIFSLF